MPVAAAEKRLDILRQIGLSAALVRLASGELLHPLFQFRCQSPPYFSYHGAGCPAGPLLVPLWDCGDAVVSVWVRDSRPEFITFSIEDPDTYAVLAHTEQGLWATVFVDLYEERDDLGPEDFRGAADAAGFAFLDQIIAAYEVADVSTHEAHEAFVRNLIEEIDAR
jgi:hypothetical protein